MLTGVFAHPSGSEPSPFPTLAHLSLILTLCGLLFFLGLGALGLTDRDEGSNAEAAREMVQSGDWTTPSLNGATRFAKPVFLYWLISGTYLAFGFSEFTARLPSAFFATALIVMQYLFARRVLGPTIGLRAALILLLNFEVLAIGRLVLTDMVLVFFITFSLFSFFLAMQGKEREKLWYWGFYVGMGIATLTKGPVGLLPIVVLIPYLLLTRQQHVLRECHPWAGSLVFLAIAAPWYTTMFLLHGSAYADSAKGDTITRFFSVIGGHGGSLLFYVPVLLLGFFPWSGFLPSAMILALRGSRELPRAPARALVILCAIWVLTLFLFFTLASTRLPHYIAPLFPAAALLVAASWERLLPDQGGRAAHFSLWLTLGLGCLLGLAFVSLEWAYDRFNPQIVLEFPSAALVGLGWSPTAVGFMILGGMGIFGYVALSGERPSLSFGIASGLMVGIALLIVTISLPRFQRYFIGPPQELAAIAGLNLESTDTLIVYGRPKPSLVFYSKRPCDAHTKCIEFIKPGEESQLVSLLTRPGQIMILTQERLRKQLPPPALTYPIVLSRNGEVLLAKKPTF